MQFPASCPRLVSRDKLHQVKHIREINGRGRSLRPAVITDITLLRAKGLVKFVPAVARLLCLVLPGSFVTMLITEYS